MSTRTVLVSVVLLALCGVVSSQPQINPRYPTTSNFAPTVPPTGAVPPSIPAPVPPGPIPDPAQGLPRLDFSPPAPKPGGPSFPDVPVAPPVPVKPAPPPEKTVEDLLTELERVQLEKALLEKKEQELKATVRKKLEQQAERLNKLGVTKEMKEPDRVGRIIIEGNKTTADQKILETLGVRPGQVLQYPALESARLKLERAGFREVSVEVIIPDAPGTPIKDIRVRVNESHLPVPDPKK